MNYGDVNLVRREERRAAHAWHWKPLAQITFTVNNRRCMQLWSSHTSGRCNNNETPPLPSRFHMKITNESGKVRHGELSRFYVVHAHDYDLLTFVCRSQRHQKLPISRSTSTAPGWRHYLTNSTSFCKSQNCASSALKLLNNCLLSQYWLMTNCLFKWQMSASVPWS